MQVVGLSVHLVERAAKIAADIRKHLAKELANPCSDGAPPVFCHEDQVISQAVNDTSSSAQSSFPHG
jgi:hypothetical protein